MFYIIFIRILCYHLINQYSHQKKNLINQYYIIYIYKEKLPNQCVFRFIF